MSDDRPDTTDQSGDGWESWDRAKIHDAARRIRAQRQADTPDPPEPGTASDGWPTPVADGGDGDAPTTPADLEPTACPHVDCDGTLTDSPAPPFVWACGDCGDWVTRVRGGDGDDSNGQTTMSGVDDSDGPPGAGGGGIGRR